MTKGLISAIVVGKPVLSFVLWCVSIYKIWKFYSLPVEKRGDCSVSGWIAVLVLTSFFVLTFALLLFMGARVVHHRQ